MNTTKRFGIEIEVAGINSRTAYDALVAAGVRAEHYDCHHTPNTPAWRCSQDISVTRGCEVVSPVLSSTDEIARVMKALVGAGGSVDTSCGLHVHVDAAGLGLAGWRNLGKMWLRYETALDSVLASSRRASRAFYCQNNLRRFGSIANGIESLDSQTTELQVRYALTGGNRYHKMNTESYGAHGTVEFRGHQGSLNAEKVSNWVVLLTRLVSRALAVSSIPVAEANLATTLDEILAPVATRSRVTGRHSGIAAELARLFSSMPGATVSEFGDAAVAAGICDRKRATRNHYHFRRAAVAVAPVAEDLSGIRSFFLERAVELAEAAR